MNHQTFFYLKTTNRKPKIQVSGRKLRQRFKTLRHKKFILQSLKTKRL